MREETSYSSETSRRMRALVVLTVVALFLAGVAVASVSGSGDPSTATIETNSEDGSSGPRDGITPAGGGGGNVNHEIVVLNTTDGRFANRAGLGVAHVSGDEVENQNSAAATASCTDCRTVAVAAQIVLVQRADVSNVSPTNVAVAINNGCLRCETFAAAYQYVVTTEGLARFTPQGMQRLNELEGQIRALAATDGVPFPELEARIDALVEQMWAVADNELVKVGQPAGGRAVKDTDVAVDGGSPSPTATTTESPTETPDQVDDRSAGADPTETPTSPGPSDSPHPSDTGSPSSDPSPTSSESPEPSSSP